MAAQLQLEIVASDAERFALGCGVPPDRMCGQAGIHLAELARAAGAMVEVDEDVVLTFGDGSVIRMVGRRGWRVDAAPAL